MPSSPKLGDVLGGQYVLRERIGEGGMGTVFLADQLALARTVAIKLLHPRYAANCQLAARFRAEAVAASRVRHQNSVVVIDCNEVDGLPYIVMEHVRGCPLGRIIAEENIPVPRAIELVLQILRALDAAHSSGVIHADVKSDNFLVEQIDGADRVTLIDFGLARLDGEKLDLRGDDGERVVSGTPAYMAPETIRGERVAAATDLYAVGVILYELLTGAIPFTGATTTEVMARQLHEPVVPPSLRRPDRDIPPALDEIVLRAMSKSPGDRFADAGEFATALRGVIRTRVVAPLRSLRVDDGAAADAPTRTCSVLPSRQLARGSACDPVRHGPIRRAIGEALARGDLERIADGYARLAAALAEERTFATAVCELEEGIDVVSGLGGAAAARAVDRLVVALAELYDELGDVVS